jgi:hypothetical protein
MFQKCYNKSIEISFGERVLFIMKKLNKKVLNSSLVIILALGLGGCAANSATTTTHNQDSTRSAKVTKQSSSKKSTKTDSKAESSSNKSVATSQSERTSVNQEGSSRVAMNASLVSTNDNSSATVQQRDANATSASSTSTTTTSNVNQNTANTQASATPKAHQEIQLGLGEVASWTDSEGTTHHVDSDGMDRYTTKGSQEVHYQDWSGSLPQNATVNVNHQN